VPGSGSGPGPGSGGGTAPQARGRRGDAARIYLLIGEEDVLVEEALRSLLDQFLPPAERALNLDVVDAGEVPIQDIITRCETSPFFGERRVLVLRRAGTLRASDQDALAAYLDRGIPSSTLLILIADSLDRRRRLYAVLQRTGRIVACEPLKPESLPGWVAARARQEGTAITPEAARELIGLVGGGLRELGLEVAKLAAYVGDAASITPAVVLEAASHASEATVFELMDAVGRRQADRALELLQTVLAMGEPPVRVLYMLEDQLRMLLRTKSLADRRAPADEVREALGNRAWLYDRYRRQVAAFGRMDVRRLLGLLLETDGMIKTGLTPPRLAIETLIARLCYG
jgi:DNA polymerase III subunit delta